MHCREVGGAANDALNKANKGPGRTKGPEGAEKNGQNTVKGQENGKNGPPEGQAKLGKPNGKTGKSKGPGPGKAGHGEQAKNKSGKQPGGTQGDMTAADDPKAKSPDQKLAQRGSNLTLEDLKKLNTPDKRKQANITEEQWRKYLKDRQQYDQTLERLNAQLPKNPKDKAAGSTSMLPSTGPQKVGSKVNSTDNAVLSGRPEAPPEFLEAQQRFTRSSPNSKKK